MKNYQPLRENIRPNCVKNIIKIKLKDFKILVTERRDYFLSSLKEGDAYIVKQVVDKEILKDLKNQVHNFGTQTKESWHDTKSGIPNFHQIDNELKYFKIKKIAHTYHFFSWNKDEPNVYDIFSEMLKLYQIINGHRDNKFPHEINNHDVVNRLQIHHYPSGGGYMDNHNDPDIYLNTLAIIYMSKYGVDYQTGGLYFIDRNNLEVSVDKLTDIGDMVFAYPTITHGCKPIDSDESINWDYSRGRWLVLFNTLLRQ